MAGPNVPMVEFHRLLGERGTIALLLLVAGSALPFVGVGAQITWLGIPSGMVVAWFARDWGRRQKIVASAVVLVAMALPFVLAVTVARGWGMGVLALLLLWPVGGLLAALYLYVARRNGRTGALVSPPSGPGAATNRDVSTAGSRPMGTLGKAGLGLLVAASALFLTGGATFLAMPVAVILVWVADDWARREKLIGSAIVVAGIAAPFAVALTVGRDWGFGGLVLLLLIPVCGLLGAAYLYRARRKV